MKEITNILVCLDLSDIDPYLIKYAAYMADIFDVRKAYFIHAIQAYDLPDKRKKSYPDVKAALDQKIREELDEIIDRQFERGHDTEVVTKIEEEDAADGILISIEERDIDLILIGQKPGEGRKGRYGKKIAANAPCDILFIPQNSEPKRIEKALCAIDFSEASEAAFQAAIYLAEKHRVDMTCYFIQDTSTAYFPASTSKSASRKKDISEIRYQEVLDKYNVKEENFPCRIKAGDATISEPEKLYDLAEEEDCQFIIVGARGDTANETSLLGNITETLRRMHTDIPIMIVKSSHRKTFFDYFRSGEND